VSEDEKSGRELGVDEKAGSSQSHVEGVGLRVSVDIFGAGIVLRVARPKLMPHDEPHVFGSFLIQIQLHAGSVIFGALRRSRSAKHRREQGGFEVFTFFHRFRFLKVNDRFYDIKC